MRSRRSCSCKISTCSDSYYSCYTVVLDISLFNVSNFYFDTCKVSLAVHVRVAGMEQETTCIVQRPLRIEKSGGHGERGARRTYNGGLGAKPPAGPRSRALSQGSGGEAP